MLRLLADTHSYAATYALVLEQCSLHTALHRTSAPGQQISADLESALEAQRLALPASTQLELRRVEIRHSAWVLAFWRVAALRGLQRNARAEQGRQQSQRGQLGQLGASMGAVMTSAGRESSFSSLVQTLTRGRGAVGGGRAEAAQVDGTVSAGSAEGRAEAEQEVEEWARSTAGIDLAPLPSSAPFSPPSSNSAGAPSSPLASAGTHCASTPSQLLSASIRIDAIRFDLVNIRERVPDQLERVGTTLPPPPSECLTVSSNRASPPMRAHMCPRVHVLAHMYLLACAHTNVRMHIILRT